MSSRPPAFFFLLTVLLCTAPIDAQDWKLGASIRGYQFFRFEDLPFQQRRDSELWILRVTHQSGWGSNITFEAHGVLGFLSPPFAGVSRLAVAEARSFLPLDHTFFLNSKAALVGNFDRLNLSFDFDGAKVVVGRQPVSWGVSFFWPALDLFAPFGPRQIDRDYKAGVDAVRVIVPLGAFSEFEMIGSVLGSSASRDGALGSLLRLNFGAVDVGFMGGTFHEDIVLGGFFTSNLRGTGLKGELSWTESGDSEDLLRNRERFWRGSLGVLRQLSPSTSLTLEVAWNGFGSSDPAHYIFLLQADRFLRGEVNALGKIYSGIFLSRQLHPLLVLGNTLLVNWNDPSALWIPSLNWSLGNNAESLLGVQLGIGRSLSDEGIPRSEYGSIPNTLILGFKAYF